MKLLSVFLIFALTLISCSPRKHIHLPEKITPSITGTEFYKNVFSVNQVQREIMAKEEILRGNVPAFLLKMVKINTSITTDDGKIIKAYYYVMPDYLSIGSDDDFARIPLTPMTPSQLQTVCFVFYPPGKW